MSDITKAPLIKWSGSKRKQAPQIVDTFPRVIDTYFEPFVGGASVLHEVLNRVYEGDMEVKKFICSDLNKDLISIWDKFQNNPNELFDYYCKQRETLFKYSGLNSYDDKIDKEHIKAASVFYYEERDRFNHMEKDNPERGCLFFWITKTCFNGLIRYNPKGYFNVPFHVGGGLGQSPENLEKVMEAWTEVMKDQKIFFLNESYECSFAEATNKDIIYMDPPYANFEGMYFLSGFDSNKFFKLIDNLNERNIKWFLSYDGKTGDDDRTEQIPVKYSNHIYINSGASNFKKLKSKSVGTNPYDIVYDSLYIS